MGRWFKCDTHVVGVHSLRSLPSGAQWMAGPEGPKRQYWHSDKYNIPRTEWNESQGQTFTVLC